MTPRTAPSQVPSPTSSAMLFRIICNIRVWCDSTYILIKNIQQLFHLGSVSFRFSFTVPLLLDCSIKGWYTIVLNVLITLNKHVYFGEWENLIISEGVKVYYISALCWIYLEPTLLEIWGWESSSRRLWHCGVLRFAACCGLILLFMFEMILR